MPKMPARGGASGEGEGGRAIGPIRGEGMKGYGCVGCALGVAIMIVNSNAWPVALVCVSLGVLSIAAGFWLNGETDEHHRRLR
jgi:hypothetical protein